MKTKYFQVCFILHLCKEIISLFVARGHPDLNTGCQRKRLESSLISALSLNHRWLSAVGDVFIKCGEMAQCGGKQQLRSAITTSDRAISSSLKAIIATITTGEDHKKRSFLMLFYQAFVLQ